MRSFVSLNSVSFSNNGKEIIRDIDLEIECGKVLAILGPNGAGKSTLLELILKDYKPSKGKINYHFNEKNIFKNKIGVVYNNQHIFPQLYVRELVDFYKKLYKSDGKYLSELITLFDLKKLQDSLVRKLSEGEKKKLQIALAIFHQPEFIVMDEPFSNVDITITDIIWTEIKRIGATTVLVTHDWEFAENFADEILFLDKGEILLNKFSPSEKENILSAKKKLITEKNDALLQSLLSNNFYEKDAQLNIMMTSESDLQVVKKHTFNYSIMDVTIRDIYNKLSVAK